MMKKVFLMSCSLITLLLSATTYGLEIYNYTIDGSDKTRKIIKFYDGNTKNYLYLLSSNTYGGNTRTTSPLAFQGFENREYVYIKLVTGQGYQGYCYIDPIYPDYPPQECLMRVKVKDCKIRIYDDPDPIFYHVSRIVAEGSCFDYSTNTGISPIKEFP